MRRKIILLLSVLLVISVSLFAFTFSSAYAGDITSTLIEERFSSGKLEKKYWHISDQQGISFNSSDNLNLVIENPTGGSSITSKIAVSGGRIRVQIDINEISFGENATEKDAGIFGIAYNATLADGSVYDINQTNRDGGNGIYFRYLEENDVLAFASMSGGLREFYDGQGNRIEQVHSLYPYYDASVLSLSKTGVNSTVIKDKTLTVDFYDGEMFVYAKTLGQSGIGDLIIKTQNARMPRVKDNGLVGMCFAEGNGNSIEYISIGDLRVYKLNSSNETVGNALNSFSMGKDNYKLYYTSVTKNFEFTPTYSMSLDQNFSNEYPLLISSPVIINDFEDTPDSYDNNIEFNAKIKINSIDENAKFGFVSGIESRVDCYLGDKDTSFVYITKSAGKYKCGALTYTDKNVSKDIFSNYEFETDEVITLYVKINRLGELTVKINGESVYSSLNSGECKIYDGSYCGFSLSGKQDGFSTEITKVVLKNRYYYRPENADLFTDFDNDEFNENDWLLYSSPYLDTYTNSAYVKDGELMFENVAMNSGFSTQKEFSDFSIKFDVTNLRREVVYDSMGNHIYPISSWIGVAFGLPAAFENAGTIATVFPLVYIEAPIDDKTWDRAKDGSGKNKPVTVTILGNGVACAWELSDFYDFWDISRKDIDFQMKVKVISDTITVGVKYKDYNDSDSSQKAIFDSEGFRISDRNGVLMQAKMKKSLSGHVSICGMGCNVYQEPNSVGASCGYFAVDNVSVKNLDYKPNTVSYEFSSNRFELPSDYPYVSQYKDEDYLPDIFGERNKSGCESNIGVKGIIVSSLLVVGALAVIFIKTRRKENV